MSYQSLPTASPASLGIDPQGILSFLDSVEERGRNPLTGEKGQHLHSFVLLRHGKVAAKGHWAPYRFQDPHYLYSLSKSFTSTAAGFAVQEGLLTLEERVVDFFPDCNSPELSPYAREMTVRHLLTMSTGQEGDTVPAMLRSPDGSWTKAFFSVPVLHPGGSYFLYNTGATYMVSAIVQQRTGQKLVDYLQPRLFEPLGIPHPHWDECPAGRSVGGWGLKLAVEDIAKFGQFLLQRGSWEGRQLLSSQWIDEATSAQMDNSARSNPSRINETADWVQGYGYQFWRCQNGGYRADGAGGQLCVVAPDQELVFACTAGIQNFQILMDDIWDYLLPACQERPLPEDPALQSALENRIAGLQWRYDGGCVPPGKDWSGRYMAQDNPLGIRRLDCALSRDRAALTLYRQQPDGAVTEKRLEAGLDRWLDGRSVFYRPGTYCAAMARWEEGTVLSVQERLTDSLERVFYQLAFGSNGPDGLTMEIRPGFFFQENKPAVICFSRI